MQNQNKWKVFIAAVIFLFSFASIVHADDDSSAANANDDTSTSPTGLNNTAFQQLLQNYFPLTPSQIHQFKDAVAEQQQANATPPGNAPPEGTSSIIPVTLKPGGVMPVIRIGQGMLTSLVFTDLSGQVWPITSYSIGDPQSFNVQWDKSSGVLMIQGQKLYAQTNIGVMLQGLQIPVMLNLLIGQSSWDYLDYIQINQYQPGDSNSSMPVDQAPSYLVDLLNGLPPAGSTQMNVSDNMAAQVWSYQGQYIMVTRFTMISPAFISRADGPGSTPMHAYAFQPTPEILLSNMGNIEKLLISTGSNNAANS